MESDVWPTVMWTGIICIVLIGNYFGYKRRASRDRMLEKLAEHGQTLPPDAFRDRHDRNPFTTAFVLIAAGIALALFFWAMTGGGGLFKGEAGVPNWLPSLGLFPFLVGIALLLGALADRRNQRPDT